MAQLNSKQNFGVGGSQSHSRSISQPTFSAHNCLPPLSPLPHSDSSLGSNSSLKDVSMEEIDVSSGGPGAVPSFVPSFTLLPPRKGHRRSNSDTVPLPFAAMVQSPSPQSLVPISGMTEKPILLQRREFDMKSNGDEVVDEYNTLMDVWDVVKMSCGESSNTQTESLREGVKRSAVEDIAPPARHYRSLSMDSAFGNMNFADGSPNNSMSQKFAGLNLKYGNGEFSEGEVKKIMADERLSELAITDPKRAKRILANRQSAARSKERKLRYISELEHKLQTIQTETTTLSTKLTIMQNDFTEIARQNNELKFRLQAMEQQTQLRDALHETLTGEVQRLRLAAQELSEESRPSYNVPQQISMDRRMFQMQHQQVATPTTASTGSTTPASASA